MKAVLVISMPENCVECPCEQHGLCLVKGGGVESIDRPSWCPIKPMPERMKVGYETISSAEVSEKVIAIGWNACIDEILGETE